jgi:hypothetical protein
MLENTWLMIMASATAFILIIMQTVTLIHVAIGSQYLSVMLLISFLIVSNLTEMTACYFDFKL